MFYNNRREAKINTMKTDSFSHDCIEFAFTFASKPTIERRVHCIANRIYDYCDERTTIVIRRYIWNLICGYWQTMDWIEFARARTKPNRSSLAFNSKDRRSRKKWWNMNCFELIRFVSVCWLIYLFIRIWHGRFVRLNAMQLLLLYLYILIVWHCSINGCLNMHFHRARNCTFTVTEWVCLCICLSH